MSKRARSVAVLLGGPSSEREISLVSGRAVAEVLRGRGNKVTEFDFDHSTYQKLLELSPDIVFIALHGRPG
jgi:D-alanine-D-alanine ligase